MNRDDLKTKFLEVTRELQTKLYARFKGTSFEPAEVTGFISRAVQRQGFGFYGTLSTIVLCTYFISDLTSLWLGRYIPEPPLSRAVRSDGQRQQRTADDYGVVSTRNLFNSKGIIPGEEGPGPGVDSNEAPVRTSLPFSLVGTLILQDEIRSIATIEDKSASMVYPVRVEDEIPSKARIIKIEARKVIFINVSSGRKEFVDLPEEDSGNSPRISLGTRTGGATAGGPGIEQVAPAQFNVARGEIDKAFSDLNNVLTQARAVPNFENGLPSGYKLFQIVPNSIYAKLGLQDGDVVKGFDGQPVNDPAKALEALNNLRNSSHVEIQVFRNGRAQNLVYDIR